MIWFRRFIRAVGVGAAVLAKRRPTFTAIIKGWLAIGPPRFPTLPQLFWACIVLFFVYVEFRTVLPVGLDEVLGEVTLDRVWYSLRYQTDINHVAVERKPHDCDFDKAPLGNKECHYQRIVGTVKEKDGKTSVYAGWQKVED